MNVMSPDWAPPDPSGVAIGVFDGVHVGHQHVLGRLVDRCRRAGLASGVLTFDPHPVEVLAPGKAPPLLTDVDRRLELFDGLGIDWVGTLDLADIRTMAPEVFVAEVLVRRAQSRLVSVGDDFRFGHDRAGDVPMLASEGRERGFDVIPVDLVERDGAVVSSSRIRTLVLSGEVDAAARLLGRPHRVSGVVAHGDARGRALGYPTANIADRGTVAMPANGIYAVRVGGPVQAEGVASIGVRPTFGSGGARLLEVHLFDYEGDLYGTALDVDFVARLRGEEQFESVDELVSQMDQDSERARRALL